jgi:hypothetical protein
VRAFDWPPAISRIAFFGLSKLRFEEVIYHDEFQAKHQK